MWGRSGNWHGEVPSIWGKWGQQRCRQQVRGWSHSEDSKGVAYIDLGNVHRRNNADRRGVSADVTALSHGKNRLDGWQRQPENRQRWRD